MKQLSEYDKGYLDAYNSAKERRKKECEESFKLGQKEGIKIGFQIIKSDIDVSEIQLMKEKSKKIILKWNDLPPIFRSELFNNRILTWWENQCRVDG